MYKVKLYKVNTQPSNLGSALWGKKCSHFLWIFNTLLPFFARCLLEFALLPNVVGRGKTKTNGYQLRLGLGAGGLQMYGVRNRLLHP